MTEDESYKLNPSYLLGKIRSLQFTLNLVIATLPEEYRDYICHRLEELARGAEEEATRKDTDPARDFLAAAHDTKEFYELRSYEEAEIFADRKDIY